MSYAADILRTIDELPPLPQASLQLLRIVNDSEFERDDLVRIVSMDPPLTAKVLGLCNSSLFALRHQVTTVHEAIGFIGAANLAKIVVSTCMSSYYKDGDSGYSAKPGETWEHSVACAIS